jgi:hypothetical protein
VKFVRITDAPRESTVFAARQAAYFLVPRLDFVKLLLSSSRSVARMSDARHMKIWVLLLSE